MFKLNLKIAWRNLLKYKGYAAMNIFGLALGLAGFIFIVLFINHEKSYDTWNPELKNVYQVQEYTDYYPVETEFHWKENIDRRLSTIFSNQLPQVKALTMVEKETEKGITVKDNTAFLQSGIRRSDSLFFKVMPFTFTYGSAQTAFAKPFSVVLKEDVAKKYFGTMNPIGQTIVISGRNKGSENNYTVTGVVEAPTTPSVVTFNAIYIDNGPAFRFGAKFDPTEATEMYVKAAGINNLEHFNNVLQSAYLPVKEKHLKEFNESVAQKVSAGHQPLIRLTQIAEVHQHPLKGQSWHKQLSPVLLLSVLLLLVSIVNFVNMATAQATGRAKEIGIKKVVGAQKNVLILQFLTETFIQCLIALFVGLLIVEISLPVLNTYFSLNLSLFNGQVGKLLWQLMLIAILATLLAGIYPSFFLSSYKPKEVLKGNLWTGKKGIGIRKALVGLQFVVAISFITGILFVTYQINYLKTRDNGFSTASVLNVRLNFSYGMKKEYDRLKSIDGVQYVGYSSGVIGTNQPSGSNFKFKDEEKELLAIGLSMEGLRALDARLIEGRFFSDSVAEDTTRNVMINEAAAKLFSERMVGQHIIARDTIPLKVIGILKDIQVAGFDAAVKPSVYVVQSAVTDQKIGTYYTPSTLIKFEPTKLKNVIAGLEKIFQEKNNFYPLKYSFLEDDIAHVLVEHERFERMVGLFSFLSLTLSLFGLFSLAAFITRQRTKEIAVRKVLGAENTDIMVLLNKGYVWILLIANAIAVPLTYILVNKWLSTFAYRIEISPVPFLLAFAASVFITILTVSLQAKKAVRANPVKALKYE